MTLRLSFAAVVVTFLSVACGDSTNPATKPGGGSSNSAGASAELAGGADAGDSSAAAGSSNVAGGGGTTAGRGGSSNHGGAGSAPLTNDGQGGTSASIGGAGADSGVAGSTAGSTDVAGSGGALVSGVPPNWLMVDDVDYSNVPGPNFDTVRLMFEGAQCSGSSCHYGGKNHFQMGKPPDQLYTYLMSFKTLQCGKLIDTANPSESAIVKYLRGPCGMIERMPSFKCFEDTDELCVPEYYIHAIEQWIALGAPR